MMRALIGPAADAVDEIRVNSARQASFFILYDSGDVGDVRLRYRERGRAGQILSSAVSEVTGICRQSDGAIFSRKVRKYKHAVQVSLFLRKFELIAEAVGQSSKVTRLPPPTLAVAVW